MWENEDYDNNNINLENLVKGSDLSDIILEKENGIWKIADICPETNE